jgi:predicted transcriptional regulator
MKKIWSTYHEEQKAKRIARAKGYAKRVKDGETISAIAREVGVSRQKIHALIRTLKK